MLRLHRLKLAVKSQLKKVLKLIIVLLAVILTYMCNKYDVEYYYFAYSISYAVIAGISAWGYVLTSSKLLLLYASFSFLTSVLHFAVALIFYDELKYIIWNAPINLSVIIELLEVMLIITGCGSVIIYITNMFNHYHNKRQGTVNSMANIK
jgi:hypothetical protein